MSKYLSNYVVDTNVKVIEVASSCLRKFLSTKRGHFLLSSLQSKNNSGSLSKDLGGEFLDYLLPFSNSRKKETQEAAHHNNNMSNTKESNTNGTKPKVEISDKNLWKSEGKNYGEWICDLSSALCETVVNSDSEIFNIVAPICRFKSEFSEMIFPHVIFHIIKDTSSDLGASISSNLMHAIISPAATLLDHQLSPNLLSGAMQDDSEQKETQKINKACIQTVLHTFNFLRKQAAMELQRNLKIDKNPVSTLKSLCELENTPFWRNINPLSVAKAAHICSNYVTAVLFIEISCQRQFGELKIPQNEESQLFSPQNSVKKEVTPPEKLEEYWRLLLEAYSNIDEPDGIYGIKVEHETRSHIKIYEHEGNWGKALEAYDRILSAESSILSLHASTNPRSLQAISSVRREEKRVVEERIFEETGKSDSEIEGTTSLKVKVLKCLQNLGQFGLLDNLLRGYISSTRPEDPEAPLFAEFQFQSAWRNLNFNLECKPIGGESKVGESKVGVDSGAYFCLKALKEKDIVTFEQSLRRSRLSMVAEFSRAPKG